MAEYEAQKARVQELADRVWDVPAIEGQIQETGCESSSNPLDNIATQDLACHVEPLDPSNLRRGSGQALLRMNSAEGLGHPCCATIAGQAVRANGGQSSHRYIFIAHS